MNEPTGSDGRNLSTLPKAITKLSKATRWTSLSAIGSRPIARLVILIPLIGYWIIFNKSLQSYVALWWDMASPPDGLAVPWKLLSTYFGLCFIAVASLLYELFCPWENKLYSSAEEYAAARYDYTSDLGFDRAKVELDLNRPKTYTYHDLMIDIRPGTDIETRLRLEKKNNLVLLDLYFENKNQSMLLARVVTQILYIIEFVALTVLAISIFMRVCGELYHSAVL